MPKKSAKAIRDDEVKAYAMERLREAWNVATGDHHREEGGIWYDMGRLASIIDCVLTTLETGDRSAWLTKDHHRPLAISHTASP